LQFGADAETIRRALCRDAAGRASGPLGAVLDLLAVEKMTMPTDDSRIPLMPVLPWQRPLTTRNRKGQWMAGVTGNPRGRPTNARLAAKRAATGRYAKLIRIADYEGLTAEQFVRLARVAYGKQWQGPLAADLGVSGRGIIRWAKGEHKISHEKEMRILAVCLRRACGAHALVRAMYRRAAAAERARLELASIPASQTSDPTGAKPDGFLTRHRAARCLSNVSPLVAVLKAAEGEIFTERGDPNQPTTSLIDNRAASRGQPPTRRSPCSSRVAACGARATPRAGAARRCARHPEAVRTHEARSV
jgi:hypothetical protein